MIREVACAGRLVGVGGAFDHPTEGRIRLPGIPVTFSETPGDIRRLPPRLGEHSVEILRELGYDGATIEALLAAGATKE